MRPNNGVPVKTISGFIPIERPQKYGKWKTIRLALWNPEDRSVLGRTTKSWSKIIFFYLCFYAGLIVLFTTCFLTLLTTVNAQRPVYLQDDSLIGSNPGMGFRPISENVDIDGSLIWTNGTKNSKWVNIIDTFLEPYRRNSSNENQVTCDYNTTPPEHKVCLVDVEHWAPCNAANAYSYNDSSPCIFVKLNKIYGWVPEYHTDSTSLPEAMPHDVRELIESATESTLNTVWVSCDGETPVDRENVGPIEYYPQQGFAGYYFPYLNIPGYLSPLVAVRFAKPQKHVLINIECRAWARNIIYSNTKGIREGSVHFEILID